MREFTWIGSKGNKLSIEVEYKETIEKLPLTADGQEIISSRTQKVIDASMIVKNNGIIIEKSWNATTWIIIGTSTKGIKKFQGLDKIGFNEEVAKEIELFISEIIESAKVEVEEELKENSVSEKIIEAAKTTFKNADGTLFSEKQAKEFLTNYNNVQNEGHDGYLPTVITQEAFDRAQSTTHKEKIK